MGDVVELDVITTLDIPTERILRKAGEEDLESVVVLGWSKDGDMYFSSSISDGPEVVWLFETAKAQLIKIGLNEE